MDNALTTKIQAYIEQDEAKRSTVEGAQLLLQLNRNRYFFNNAIRNPKSETIRAKIFRELKKWLNIRLDGLTAAEVAAMTPKIEAIGNDLELLERIEAKNEAATPDTTGENAEKAIAVGKRADHDQLPEEIQARYVENLTLLQKERALHEKLKLMRDAEPCDRYESAKLLIELDEQRLANWSEYDKYVIPESKEASTEDGEAETATDEPAADTAKAIQAARTYISRNTAKLRELKEDETKLVDYTVLKNKVQERYNTLKELEAEISDETRATLEELGVTL